MTKIEWADRSWNPVTGCTKVSPGCRNCYAERMARRLAGRYGYPEAPNHFDVTCHPDRLDQPLQWKRPKRIFVNSMSDFFHPAIPIEFQSKMFSIMRRCPQHTFMILTKRVDQLGLFNHVCGWPDLSNVWLGVTAENQQAADERIPLLLKIPAAARFVSVEPMLSRVNLGLAGTCPKSWGVGYRPISDLLTWVICGGESGPGARPMHPEWPRDLRNQCVAAGIPYFFKSWGEWLPASQWPTTLNRMYRSVKRCQMKSEHFYRVGKKAAGRLLDGRIWDQMPTPP